MANNYEQNGEDETQAARRTAYALGQTAGAEQAEVAAELAASPQARQEAEAVEALAARLKEAALKAPQPEPSPVIREAVERRLAELEPVAGRATAQGPARPWWRSRMMALATIACLVALAVPIGWSLHLFGLAREREVAKQTAENAIVPSAPQSPCYTVTKPVYEDQKGLPKKLDKFYISESKPASPSALDVDPTLSNPAKPDQKTDERRVFEHKGGEVAVGGAPQDAHGRLGASTFGPGPKLADPAGVGMGLGTGQNSWDGGRGPAATTAAGNSGADLGASKDSLGAPGFNFNNGDALGNFGDLPADGAAHVTFSGPISGAGVLTLSGSNTYSGGTTVSAGTLVAGSSVFGAVGSEVNVNEFQLVPGAGAKAGAAHTLGGVLSGNGSLTWAGTNGYAMGQSYDPPSLNDAGTFWSGANITGGTVSASLAGVAGTAAYNGSLTMAGSGSTVVPNGNTGFLSVSGLQSPSLNAADARLSNSNVLTLPGGVTGTFSGGTTTLGAGGSLTGPAVTTANASGATSVNVNSGSVLALPGTAGTMVNNGTLVIGNNTALSTGPVTVNATSAASMTFDVGSGNVTAMVGHDTTATNESRKEIEQKESELFKAEPKKPADLQKALETWKPAHVVPNTSRLMVGDKEELPIKGMQVDVRVDGFRARVLMDLYYFNDRPQQLEGNFQLRLPDEAAPYFFAFGRTVYQAPQITANESMFFKPQQVSLGDTTPEKILQLRGNSWEQPKVARMVPKEKAALAYRDTVRRRVDPALVEWSGAGVFQCRVFPLAPQSLHRVTVGYNVNLVRMGDDLELRLDLPGQTPATIVDLNISATDARQVQPRRPRHVLRRRAAAKLPFDRSQGSAACRAAAEAGHADAHRGR